MTDQPEQSPVIQAGGTMLKLKIKRDPVTGVATVDPSDPMAALIMGILGTDVLQHRIDDLLNPEGDDMPEIKDKDTGLPGYEFPSDGSEAVFSEPSTGHAANQTAGQAAPSAMIGAEHTDYDERNMRRQAMEFAVQSAASHGGRDPNWITDAAEKYYTFLRHGTTDAEKLAQPAVSG